MPFPAQELRFEASVADLLRRLASRDPYEFPLHTEAEFEPLRVLQNMTLCELVLAEDARSVHYLVDYRYNPPIRTAIVLTDYGKHEAARLGVA